MIMPKQTDRPLSVAERSARKRARRTQRTKTMEAALATIAGQHVLTLSQARTLAREALHARR
jgi:hypothetical protein